MNIFVIRMNTRIIYTLLLLHIFVQFTLGQNDRKAGELKSLETAVTNAEARVAIIEKRVSDADSIINAGKRMLDESKAELKSVDSDSKKFEKVYDSKRKETGKQANSKDKTEANRARTELRNIDSQYKTESRALETRLREATRKQTMGITNIQKGKTARKNAEEALKVANQALKAARAKYYGATGEK